jgi:hypothetical protein
LENLVAVTLKFPNWLNELLEEIGLGIIVSGKYIVAAFRIPSDSDDSSVNVALGSYLKRF